MKKILFILELLSIEQRLLQQQQRRQIQIVPKNQTIHIFLRQDSPTFVLTIFAR